MHAQTISELAHFYNLSLRTLRFYEQRGLLNPIREGSRRFYTEKDTIRLELILKGKRLGFTLLEIERLLAESPSAKAHDRQELPLGKAQIDERLQALQQKRDALDGAIVELREVLAAKA